MDTAQDEVNRLCSWLTLDGRRCHLRDHLEAATRTELGWRRHIWEVTPGMQDTDKWREKNGA